MSFNGKGSASARAFLGCLALVAAAACSGHGHAPADDPGDASPSINSEKQGGAPGTSGSVTSGSATVAAPSTPRAVQQAVSVPFDISSVMRQVHFAYRAEGDGKLTGGHSSYAVESSSDGLKVTPLKPSAASQAQLLDANGRPPDPGVRTPPMMGAPGLFKTTRIGDLQATRSDASSLAEDGSVNIVRGTTVEHLRNTDDGVEQSWTFTEKPVDPNDLVVELQVSGESYAGSTAYGVHFVDSNTRLGLRYGVGTWVDANGKRTPVMPIVQDDKIVLRVPKALVDASPFPAELDPTISAEFGMDNLVNGTAPNAQANPAVACAVPGTYCLVVWADQRLGSYDIYGARVTGSTGTVVEKSGIVISAAAGDQYNVSVAYDSPSNNFLVVWGDARNGIGNYDIYGARVGVVLGDVKDPSGIPISTATGHQTEPGVASNGTNFMVVWTDGRAGVARTDIYGARVAASTGVLVDGPSATGGFAISTVAGYKGGPQLAWDSTNLDFLVVWSDNRNASTDIYGARINPAGTPMTFVAPADTAGIPISTALQAQTYPQVAFSAGATGFFVVWLDNRNTATTGYDVYGARVSSAGVVGDGGAAVGLAITTAPNNQSYPAGPKLDWDGTNWVVVWGYDDRSSADDAYAMRVSTGGVLGDGTAATGGFAVSTASCNQGAPAIGFDGLYHLVAWSDCRAAGQADIYGMRINKATWMLLDGTAATGGFLISNPANTQTNSAVAFDGTNYLVVWEDDRNLALPGRGIDIYGTLVSKAGGVLNMSGIPIATGNYDETSPAVAYDGANNYMVAWSYPTSGGGIYVGRVAKTVPGSALDGAAGVLVSGGINQELDPALAFDGTNFLLTWTHYGTSFFGIYAHRLSKTGPVIAEADITMSLAGGGPSAVTWDGSNYVVVWSDDRLGTGANIWGARFNSSGAPNLNDFTPTVTFPAPYSVDNAGISISAGANAQTVPSIASNGTTSLVVWQDARAGAANTDIYGARVTDGGGALGVLDPSGIAISTAAGNQTAPAVVNPQDSVGYLAVWADARTGTSRDIYGSWLRYDGSVLDPSGYPIANVATDEDLPAIAAEGAGRVLISYHKYDPASPFGSKRVRAKFVGSGTAVSGGCGVTTDCATRYCVDGYCCQSLCNAACQTCSATPGTCTQVKGADDNNECNGVNTCDAAGACKSKRGQPCSGGTTCATGICADSTCCDASCAGGCDTCNNVTGTCTAVAAGNAGANPPCAPYLCSGGANCPATCAVDTDCVSTHYCAAGTPGTCQPRLGQGQACNLTTDCKQAGCRECTSTNCVNGYCCDTACADACDVCNATPGTCTLVSKGNPGTPSCAPYFCPGNAAICGNSCVNDGDCVATSYCAGDFLCKSDQDDGAGCSSDSQCKNAHCIDKVCCDTTCTGLCKACSAAAKGSGADGVCDFIKLGTDPEDECSDDGVSGGNACKKNGSCNGAGACQLYAQGVSCGATSCTGDLVTGQICDGLGNCTMVSNQDCSPYHCTGSACANPCQTIADCVAGYFCDTGTCKPKQANSTPCTDKDQCTSGFCVKEFDDTGVASVGICCDSACNGVCQSCKAAYQSNGPEGGAPADGICGFAKNGADPHNSCLDDGLVGASKCQKDGLCNGSGACRLYAAGTACGATSCVNNVQTGFACNGSGACMPGSMTDCKDYLCVDTNGTCNTTCMAGADCKDTAWCDLSTGTGICKPKTEVGKKCAVKAECANDTFCVDGVCCNAPCLNQCEACDVAGTEGTCTAVVGAAHGMRTACAAGTTDKCEAASCDGTVRDSCAAKAGPTVECRAASCADGVATLAASCSGTGMCPAAQTKMCAPYACDATACKTMCAADADCATGNRCDTTSHKCVSGATCATDGHTLTVSSTETKDCAPFRCEGDKCKTACVNVDDCVAPAVCTAANLCALPGAPGGGDMPGAAASDSGGCGCRVPGGESQRGHGGLLLAGAMAVAALRRRRSREGSTRNR